MESADEVANDVLYGEWKRGYEIPWPLVQQLGFRISAALRKDRERSARIVEMAPLDVSLEQLALLIRGGGGHDTRE